jgi:hypothetical protein
MTAKWLIVSFKFLPLANEWKTFCVRLDLKITQLQKFQTQDRANLAYLVCVTLVVSVVSRSMCLQFYGLHSSVGCSFTSKLITYITFCITFDPETEKSEVSKTNESVNIKIKGKGKVSVLN